MKKIIQFITQPIIALRGKVKVVIIRLLGLLIQEFNNKNVILVEEKS